MTILEALAFAGCFVFNYFTVNKLGMVRWVNFHSMKWEKTLPIFTLKAAVIAALFLLMALLVLIYIKGRKNKRKLCGFMAAGSVLLTLVCVGYIIFASFKTMRSYYFICVLLTAAAALQLIKTATGLAVLKKADGSAA